MTATDVADTTPTPTATPTPTPTVTPTPSPSGTVSAALPALGDLTLSSEGLQYVRVGEPVPNVAVSKRIVQWKKNFCGFTGDGPQPGAYETLYPTIHDGNLAFYVEAYPNKSSPVSTIYIISEKIHTKHGLHIGSTLADIRALGATKVPSDSSYGDGWVIHGYAGELVFVVEGTTVIGIQVQKDGTKPAIVGEITPCD